MVMRYKPVTRKEVVIITMEQQLTTQHENINMTSKKAKTLDNTSSATAADNVGDIEIFGNPDLWQLISKASSKKEGWMKSTKVMQVGKHVLVQVTTQQMNPDGSYTIAEALTTMPNTIVRDGKLFAS